jgi:protein TonB
MKPTIDELVFENRNKAYGAYFLRKIYTRHLGVAVLIVSSVLLAGMGSRLIYKHFFEEKEIAVVKKVEDVKLEEIEIPPLEENAPPPPPPPPVEQPKVKTIKHVPPKVVPPTETVTEEPIPTQTQINDAAISNTTNDEGADDDGSMTAPVEGVVGGTGVVQQEDTIPFIGTVGIEAGFPGGDEAFDKYINKSLSKSWDKASKLGIKGSVVVKWIIEKDGTISNAGIIKELAQCKSCNESALEMVKNMPKWDPAKNNGHPVRRIFIRSIKFDFED